jgi:hypothetical protein
VNLVKPITKIYSQGFYRNLFHIFQSLVAFYTYFGTLKEFSEILTQKNKMKKEQCMGRIRPTDLACRSSLAGKQPAGQPMRAVQHGRAVARHGAAHQRPSGRRG